MQNQFARTQMLLGAEALERLAASRVAVFGIGGVGGYVVEALARSGVGALDLIDSDRFSPTNLNRQLHATRKTIGQYKAEAAAERVREINPDCVVRACQTFYLPDTQDQFDFRRYDYIVDAIDTVTGKLALIENAKAAGTPIICSMGTGNKVHPELLELADLYETTVCPLARIMRKECRKRGVTALKVVYSKEKPLRPLEPAPAEERDGETPRRDIPGSTAFVPSAAGLIIAGAVVRDLVGFQDPGNGGKTVPIERKGGDCIWKL